jgi:hypothetical protein
LPSFCCALTGMVSENVRVHKTTKRSTNDF